MIRYVIGFLFVLCTGSLLAQAGSSWGISLYPNFSNRRLIAFDNISQTEIDRLEKEETLKPSYAAGGFIQWRGTKVGFQLGAEFVESGYRTIKLPLPIDDPDAANASEKRTVYRNYYLEVPVELHFFQELDDKNEFFFMLGTGISYNLSNRITTVLYDGETATRTTVKDPNDDFRTTNMEFQSAMGWETELNDQLAFVVQPTFKFWMRGILNSNLLNRNLYNLGVKIGLKFKS